MRIEKVSRYVPVVTGQKSHGATAGSTLRHMLISLPKVKFLEGGETEYYHKYKELVDDPKIPNPSYSEKWCEEVKARPLTELEITVEKMINDGYTHTDCAKKVGIQRGSISNVINRVRVKRAFQALKG